MSLTNQPVIILREGTERTQGRDALTNNIMAAKIIAETVKSALGPRGMDKMLIDSFGDITITNDGATILKEIDVQHPGSKFVIDLAKTQDEETGDGTTTVVILAGELLKAAEELIDLDVHPSIIVEGYRLAMDKSLSLLDDVATEIDESDTENLRRSATTSMSSKVIASEKNIISNLVVEAAMNVLNEGKVDIDNIMIIKKQGGSLNETNLVAGLVLDKEVVHSEMPKSVKDAKILLLNTALETVKTEFDSKLNISSPEQVQMFLDREQEALKTMADKIAATGATVVFCQKGIDDMVQHFLAQAGIMAVRRVKKSDMTKISKATGAPVISNLTGLNAADVGSTGLVEERTIADDKLLFVVDTPKSRIATVVIRGGTEFVLDEYERSIHDALCVVRNVLEDKKVVPGGGAPEVFIAQELRNFLLDKPSKIQLAIECFAKALEVIPRTLAENAGLDPIEILGQLKNKYKEGKHYFGVTPESSDIADMRELGILEPVRVKYQAISSAAEAATMLLRIDDVIAVKSSGGGGGMPEDMDF